MVYISAYQVNTHAFKRTIKFNACQHCEEVVEESLISVNLLFQCGKILLHGFLHLLHQRSELLSECLESTQLLGKVVNFLYERNTAFVNTDGLESILCLLKSLVSNSLGCVCILLSACCSCTGCLGGGLNLVDQTLGFFHSLQRLVGVVNSCGKA